MWLSRGRSKWYSVLAGVAVGKKGTIVLGSLPEEALSKKGTVLSKKAGRLEGANKASCQKATICRLER